VVIKRLMTCRKTVVVGKTKVSASGAFRVALKRPARLRAAIYLTSSRVRHASIRTRTVRTNSLPLPIALR